MVGKAVELSGLSQEVALRSFGKYLFGELVRIHKHVINLDLAYVDFLKTVETIIHIEVKKIYADAKPPRFIFPNAKDEKDTLEFTTCPKGLSHLSRIP